MWLWRLTMRLPRPLARACMRFSTGALQWLHLNKVLALAEGQREARTVLLDLYRIT